ncbi:tyrosine-type recombinase/integrase [Lactiplantibacillus plantarum]|uniref:tyrosine-type recombinase/integrase n=1 Tax=Lactiplantibacillus plantarum TaxID=1590 RepID=UPI003C2CE4DC
MKVIMEKNGSNRKYRVTGYLGTYTSDDGDKKQVNFNRGGFSSVEAAKLAFNRAKNSLQRRTDIDTNKVIQRQTFEDVYHIWLSTYRLGVKESTLNRVIGVFKHHILPSLGNRYIDTITWQQCQQAALEWRKKVKQFNKLAQYAALVFRTAEKMDLITRNPMKLVDVPANGSNHDKDTFDNFWTSDQLSKFLSTIDRTDIKANIPRYDRSALFYLLATTGIRKGECLALAWSDLDLTHGTVSINKTVSRSIDNRQIITTPKTRNAYRTLALDQLTISRLKSYRKSLVLIPRATDLVFKNHNGGILSVMTPNHWLEKFIDKAELPRITVHGLRHTFASIQVANNINVKALQMQMGHSDIKITLNIYAHLTRKQLSAQVFSISDALSNVSSQL